MVTKMYRDYLKSDAWARKRAAAFARYGKRCMACGTTRGAIQVHHLTYARLGRENMGDLRPLCWKCHQQVTRLHYKMGKRTPGIVVFQEFVKLKRKRR